MEEDFNLYTCTCGAQYVAEKELEECNHPKAENELQNNSKN